jgi:mono/diheme cytochrome c family protein
MRASASSHAASLTQAQIVDLSHFLRQRIEAVTRNRTPTAPIDVLTGDPEEGRRYFNGAGRCSTCHSPTGDFAGLRTRTPDALTLQQRVLFPTLIRSTKKSRSP